MAGGVVRGEERRVGVLAEASAGDVPTGSSSLESTPGPAIVETMMEVSQKSKAKTTTHVCVLSRSVLSDSLRPHALEPARLLCPWDSPG